DELAQHADDALALEEPRAGEGEVEQAQHVQALERRHPRRVLIELARRVDPADDGADRGAGDGADDVAVRLEPANHTDMGKAASPAAAEHEGDSLACAQFPDLASGTHSS